MRIPPITGRRMPLALIISTFLLMAGISSAFVVSRTIVTSSRTSLFALENDKDYDSDSSDSSSSSFLYTALKQRQLSLTQSQQETETRWRMANCQSYAAELPDWVRRVSVQWPLAACGSSSGDIYLVHCETGTIIAKGESQQDQNNYIDAALRNPSLVKATRNLFGDYDGGGTLALAFGDNNLIAHAGRDGGGVELWKLTSASNGEQKLVSKGKLMEGKIVTSLEWGALDDLWIGTQDGIVVVYSFEDDDEELLPSSEIPTREWDKLGGTILSLSYDEDLDVTVISTSNGKVQILSLDDPSPPSNQKSFYPPFDSGRRFIRNNVFPRCATIVKQKNDSNASTNHQQSYAVVVGGNDGSLYVQMLNLLGDDDKSLSNVELDIDCPFEKKIPPKALKPGHDRSPCTCLVSPFPGLVISGGQDGTVRVWDLNNANANTANDSTDNNPGLYLMTGFKVWLGSLWTDGTRLVTDGADNTILVYDFGQDAMESF